MIFSTATIVGVGFGAIVGNYIYAANHSKDYDAAFERSFFQMAVVVPILALWLLRRL